MQNVINGTRRDDFLAGTILDDSISGGQGNDTLSMSPGADLLDGGAGDDKMYVASVRLSDTTMLGGDGDDLFWFLPGGKAQIDGGAGDDVFQFGNAGSLNTVTGGAGRDLYEFSDVLTGGTVADFAAGPGGDRIALPRVIADDSSVILGRNLFADGPLHLYQDGADTLLTMSYAGKNILLLTLQNMDASTLTADNFTIGASPDGNNVGLVLAGGAAAESLAGGSFNDTINGGDGNDTLTGGYGGDRIDGGAGDDRLNYANLGGDDVLLGGDGNDTLSAWSHSTLGNHVFRPTMDGGAGDDTFLLDLAPGTVEASVIGGSGRDTYVLVAPTTGYHPKVDSYHVSDFTAGPGGDRIDLGALFASLNGYQGGNPFYLQGGFELVQAGANTELRLSAAGFVAARTLLVLDNVQAADLAADNFIDLIDPHGGAVPGLNVTAGTGSVLLEGGYFNDTLTGGTGKDTLHGLGGDDLLRSARKGAVTNGDSLDGGIGNDTLVGSNANDLLTDSLGNNAMDGGAGADVLLAGDRTDPGAGSNTLLGGDGNDQLTARGGAYAMDGGAGDDILAHAGGDGGTMLGGAGADRFLLVPELPRAAQVTIDGGTGNDTVEFAERIDTHWMPFTFDVVATGGTGSDTYRINTFGPAWAGLRVTDFQAGAGGDVLDLGRTGARLSSGDVRLVQDGADTLVQRNEWGIGYKTVAVLENVAAESLAGDNFAGSTIASLGNDTIGGTAGNDVLDGGAGNDTMSGGAGDDTYVVTEAGDTVVEASARGTDTVRAAVSHTLAANVENLVLTAGGLAGTGNGLDNLLQAHGLGSELAGAGGNDTLAGGGGADTMAGGAGNDTYLVVNAATVIRELAGQGTDKVVAAVEGYTLAANVENLELAAGVHLGSGNAQNNVLTARDTGVALYGGAGNDTLTGSIGDDTLDGGTGSDRLVGNGGNDVYIVDAAGDVVVASTFGGRVDTSLGTYRLPELIQYLAYTGTGAFTGTGNAAGNTIAGGSGPNRLDGGAGDDRLAGGAGSDTLSGGAGHDFLSTGTGAAVVDGGADSDVLVLTGAVGEYTVSRSGALDIVFTRANGDVVTARNIEQVNFDGAAFYLDQVLVNVAGPSGDDLHGTAGADLLDGAGGADTLSGGAGDDTYVVDETGDTIVEAAGEGVDLVRVGLLKAATYILADNVENAIVTAAKSVAAGIKGNALDNHLAGNAAVNQLQGGAGNDTLDGGAGADSLAGGAGDDVYVADNAGDRIVEAAGEGVDRVDTMLARFTLGANVENLRYTGTATFNGTGNALANVIEGGAGNDVLAGGGGDDVLRGGAGRDTLSGGTGADTFVLDSAGTADAITDLASGTDRIAIAQSAIGIGNGDLVIDHATTRAAAGGFDTDAELVLFTRSVPGTSVALAAAAIGSATGAYETGDTALFAVRAGTGTALYLFTSNGDDALVSAAELNLLATITGTSGTVEGDYLFIH